jgi:hypothetical protein
MTHSNDVRHDYRLSHGPRWKDPDPPTLRKVPADSVPYGDSINRNGQTVWAAYGADGVLVAVAATAKEARVKYREIRNAQESALQRENLED